MKKKSLYKGYIIIYSIFLLLAIIIVDVSLWSALKSYEKEESAKVTPKVTPAITSVPDNTPTPVPTVTPVEKVKVLVYVPKEVSLYVDGEVCELSGATEEIPDEFASLYTFIEKYKEYNDLPEKITIPKYLKKDIEISKEAEVSAKDKDGNLLNLLKTEEDGSLCYKFELISDESQKEEVTQVAFDMAVKYSMFCSGDRAASLMEPYFPAGSQYLKTISSLDNSWYTKHQGDPAYSEKTVVDYKGYSDDLMLIHINMNQRIVAYSGNVDTLIDLSLWVVKLGGSYKIAGIVY